MKSYIIVGLTLLICSQVFAQTDSLDIDDLFSLSLDEFVNLEVTIATKQVTKLKDSPASLTIITKAEIEKYGYTSLEEALSRVPEVYTHYNGNNFSADFRGFFTNNLERRVLYMLDGVVLNDRFHFGDFYPDVFSDLDNIERIEIIRGPGAALYGNNSVLGVVNIISKANKQKGTSLAVTADYLKKNSGVMQYNLFHNSNYKDIGVHAHVSWLSGESEYNSQTSWESDYGSGGIANVNCSHDVYYNPSHSDNDIFYTGKKIPNFNFELSYKDFILGGFQYSKRMSQVFPKKTNTFNHPDNDRVWGTSSVFLSYNPVNNFLSEMDFKFTCSYNYNTNREIVDFDLENSIKQLNKYFVNAGLDTIKKQSYAAFVIDHNGKYSDGKNRYTELISESVTKEAISEQTIIASGEGTRYNYYGIDKVLSFDFQITPLKKDKYNLMLGGNLNFADYNNYKNYLYRNNKLVGWYKSGGITDNGYTYGLFLQFIWSPVKNLTLTTGLRYDYQYVSEAYKQLGGKKKYIATEWLNSIPVAFKAEGLSNRTAMDITPRLAANYNISGNSTLRLQYGQAFRAVPPQEILRLPSDYGDAKSEKTVNYDVIFSTCFFNKIYLVVNGFYIKGSELYQFTPGKGFSKGSGWENTGGTISMRCYPRKGIEFWINFTKYSLERATDAYDFLEGRPNEYRALDSPELLIKTGGSIMLSKIASIACEFFYNNEIQSLHPSPPESSVMWNLHKIPASSKFNLAVNFDFSRLKLKGLRASLKLENVFNSKVWSVLPTEAENWNESRYEKPHQLPGFGRILKLKISYSCFK